MHKLSRTIAVMGLLTPLGASALGVGDIRLRSALNQSLNAEIPLVLSGSDSLSDIKVGLAGPEAFAKAGVERQYFLTKLQFSAVQKPDGSYAIQISSRDVMREPFLSFLVEVNWPQGRVLREFTVLLDPPATLPEETFAETEPPGMERPVPRYERVAEISRAEEAPPVRRRPHKAAIAAPRLAAAPSVPATPPSESQLTGETYGPIRRDENLWGIAKSLARDPSISHDQMVMALFRANPQAFRGSINTLKAGAVLRIPTQDFIKQLSPEQARSEFARQQGWSTGRLAARGEEAMAPESQLKLLAPSEAKSKTEGAVTGSEAREGKAKGELALEVAETIKQENEEFRSRLGQLEQKLGDLQRLIVVKDEQIASLQAQQHGAPQRPAETPPQATAPTPPPVPAAQTAPAVPPSGAQQPPLVSPQAPAQAESARPPEPVAKPQAPTQPLPLPQAAPKPAARRAAPPPQEEPGFSIEPAYLGVAGGIAAAGLMAWLIRRRRNAMIAETESILLAAERESQQKAYVSASKTGEIPIEPVMSPKSSFLSEFTPSDFDALGTETDEVDPIAEADVYLAYGRYKQAEELIRHAIAQHPERDECKLKLLEIYSTTENRSAFEDYVRSLKQNYKNAKTEFWAKVEDMARELAPATSQLQAPGSSVQKVKGQGFDAAKAVGGLDLSDDLIDDLKRFDIDFAQPSSMSDELFIPLSSDVGEEAAEPDETGEYASLDFEPASPEWGKSKIPAVEPLEDLLEPDNLIPFEPAAVQRPEKSPRPRTEKTIDDILRELTSSIANEASGQSSVQARNAAAVPDQAREAPGFDLELFEPEPGEEPQPEAETAERPEDIIISLTDMDQFETKLDLARAYADMEDDESAREILQDVLANGNQNQKSEAQTLLDKIGAAPSELFMPEPQSGRM